MENNTSGWIAIMGIRPKVTNAPATSPVRWLVELFASLKPDSVARLTPTLMPPPTCAHAGVENIATAINAPPSIVRLLMTSPVCPFCVPRSDGGLPHDGHSSLMAR